MNNEENLINREYLQNLRDEAPKKYPLLYCGIKKPMTETCMCWGFETPLAWMDIIDDLSKKLEAYNVMFYPKFRTRIEADQVKEKFAGLRFYYSIHRDPSPFVCKIRDFVDFIYQKLSRLDYSIEYIVDQKGYSTQEWCEVSSYSIDYRMEYYKPGQKVPQYKVCPDGKWFELCDVWHPPKSHSEVNKHKFLYWIMKKMYIMRNRIASSAKYSNYGYLIGSLMSSLADDAIRDAENKVDNICSSCGHEILSYNGPRCTTTGYYMYLCKDCAEKSGDRYTIDGDDEHVYCNGKPEDDNEARTEENTNKNI